MHWLRKLAKDRKADGGVLYSLIFQYELMGNIKQLLAEKFHLGV